MTGLTCQLCGSGGTNLDGKKLTLTYSSPMTLISMGRALRCTRSKRR